jgi:hypothetical protein
MQRVDHSAGLFLGSHKRIEREQPKSREPLPQERSPKNAARTAVNFV